MNYAESQEALGVPKVLGESTTEVLVDRDGQRVGQLVLAGGHLALMETGTPARRDCRLLASEIQEG